MFETPTRRRFFCGAATATLGLLMPRSGFGPPALSAAHQEASPEARLRRLGIELPPAPQPVATYVPAVIVGNMLYVAGHTPRRPDGSPGYQGKVGEDFTIEEGYEAARVAGVNILSTVRNTLGTLDRVVRLVRTFGMVNAVPDFGQHPQVINGCSGRHGVATVRHGRRGRDVLGDSDVTSGRYRASVAHSPECEATDAAAMQRIVMGVADGL